MKPVGLFVIEWRGESSTNSLDFSKSVNDRLKAALDLAGYRYFTVGSYKNADIKKRGTDEADLEVDFKKMHRYYTWCGKNLEFHDYIRVAERFYFTDADAGMLCRMSCN